VSAATVKPPPNAPAEWPCVECGEPKSKHKTINEKVVCFPLVLVNTEASTWRQFRRK